MDTWSTLLHKEKQQTYFIDTLEYIEQRRKEGVNIFPEQHNIFAAFQTPTFEQIKVVIIGQDPYHGAHQAHGLSFSVQAGIKIPPSLKNIYKELCNDIDGFSMPEHGCLLPWAQQGIMLLNTVLTVEEGQAHSHKQLGWERFTDHVIDLINTHQHNVVFILWGAHAQKKGKKINQKKHLVLSGPHPSPLSAHRGFFGCRHFSKTNTYLRSKNKTPINWQV